jgi:hypothetical protein
MFYPGNVCLLPAEIPLPEDLIIDDITLNQFKPYTESTLGAVLILTWGTYWSMLASMRPARIASSREA